MAASVASRLFGSIGYIEDPDSLRFALSVADTYSVAALQPHFPGYPVYWAVAKPLYLLTGHLSAAFALVGALATVGLVAAGLSLLRAPLVSPRGVAWASGVLVCPLVWLLATRYMPDLLGLAVALGALALALRAMESGRAPEAAWAGAMGGLLAGLRLSYVPFVALPLLALLARPRQRLPLVGAGLLATALWLVPLVLDTGWTDLVQAAQRQTTGHFADFGGTIQSEDAGLGTRLWRTVESVWADGLGGWWAGRHPLTAVVGLALVLGLASGAAEVARRVRESDRAQRVATWCLASGAAYAVWIVLFQNVVHKSRHALPLVALALLVLALGVVRAWRVRGRWRVAARGVVVAGGAALAVVAVTLMAQHREPTAIAQVTVHTRAAVEAAPDLQIVTTPLVRYTLEQQGVRAAFVDATAPEALARLPQADLLAVGAAIPGREPVGVDTFYHNPFVNRMWAEIPVYRYAP
ncbi:MAG: hypothetical protein AAFQ43_01345 [Bacteroidota bacterium]